MKEGLDPALMIVSWIEPISVSWCWEIEGNKKQIKASGRHRGRNGVVNNFVSFMPLFCYKIVVHWLAFYTAYKGKLNQRDNCVWKKKSNFLRKLTKSYGGISDDCGLLYACTTQSPIFFNQCIFPALRMIFFFFILPAKSLPRCVCLQGQSKKFWVRCVAANNFE